MSSNKVDDLSDFDTQYHPAQPPKLPPLRLFAVRSHSCTKDHKEAMVEAHGMTTAEGVLIFFVWSLLGQDVIQFTHRAFKDWSDVEEIPYTSSQNIH